jgi:hypothetical protein
MVASGMRFNDCVFSEPIRLAEWTPPRCAGLYAILIVDSNWAPKPFQPLYFGEFGNNAPRQAILGQDSGILSRFPGKDLWVVAFPMPFSTLHQRWALRNELVWAYNPICQLDQAKAPPSESDARQRLAASEPFSESTPERRRRIGFLPPFDSPSAESGY